jgi:hypothetical protein
LRRFGKATNESSIHGLRPPALSPLVAVSREQTHERLDRARGAPLLALRSWLSLGSGALLHRT